MAFLKLNWRCVGILIEGIFAVMMKNKFAI